MNLTATDRADFRTQYGLKLNKDMCIAAQTNHNGRIHFHDGSLLVSAYEATYIGNDINKEVNIRHEIINKMSEVHGPGTS